MTFSIDLDRVLKAVRWLVLIALLSYCAVQLNNIVWNTYHIYVWLASFSIQVEPESQVYPLSFQQGPPFAPGHYQEETWEAEKLAAKVVLRRLDRIDKELEDLDSRVTALEDE